MKEMILNDPDCRILTQYINNSKEIHLITLFIDNRTRIYFHLFTSITTQLMYPNQQTVFNNIMFSKKIDILTNLTKQSNINKYLTSFFYLLRC